MRTPRSTPRHLRTFGAAVLLLGCSLACRAQYSSGQRSGAPPMSSGGQAYPQQPASHLPGGDINASEPDPMREKMEEARVKGMRDDRRKRLESDVDKLLALATELKSDVDKTSKDELSVIVVKKAGEMEKLAHDLKERERN